MNGQIVCEHVSIARGRSSRSNTDDWIRFAGEARPMPTIETRTSQDGSTEYMYGTADILDPRKVQKLCDDGIWDETDLAPYGMRLAEPFVMPEGKMKVPGSVERFEETLEILYQVLDVQDIPPSTAKPSVYTRTVVDRLETAGLLQAARDSLDAGSLYARERWNARELIYSDDSDAVALITGIGGDPAIILAPEGEVNP